MQSETRWSRPPPARMLTSALVAVLANAILSAEPETDAVAARLSHVLGRGCIKVAHSAYRDSRSIGGVGRAYSLRAALVC